MQTKATRARGIRRLRQEHPARGRHPTPDPALHAAGRPRRHGRRRNSSPPPTAFRAQWTLPALPSDERRPSVHRNGPHVTLERDEKPGCRGSSRPPLGRTKIVIRRGRPPAPPGVTLVPQEGRFRCPSGGVVPGQLGNALECLALRPEPRPDTLVDPERVHRALALHRVCRYRRLSNSIVGSRPWRRTPRAPRPPASWRRR